MRAHFKKLLAVEGVKGVMLFRSSGEPVFGEFRTTGAEGFTASDWFELAASLGSAREAELFFERGRVYVRRRGDAVLMAVMGLIAPSAVVRLHCDILLSTLRERQPATGLRRLIQKVERMFGDDEGRH